MTTTPLFDQCFDLLMGHEGGYVNDARDPGGETNWGISKRSYPNVDIRNLTQDGAKAIYHRDFWTAMNCDALPAPLALVVFDTAVNSGRTRANAFLQDNPADWRAYLADRLTFFTDLKTWGDFGKGWARRVANLTKQAAVLEAAQPAAIVEVRLSQKGSPWSEVTPGQRVDVPTVTINFTDPKKVWIRTK